MQRTKEITNIIIGVIIAVMKETEDYFGQACCLR